MKKTFVYGTLILVLILLLSFSFILFKTFSKETIGALLGLKKRYLLLSGFFLFLYHTFDNFRLYILSRAVGLRYSVKYGYAMSFINTFGATVTPAHAGGELAAIYMLLRKGASVHKVMSIVTMKTISGIVFFLVAFPFLIHQFVRNPHHIKPVLEIMGIVFGATALLYISVNYFFKKNRGKPSLKKLRETLRKYLYYLKIFGYKRKTQFLLASLSSVLLYLSFMMIAPSLAKAFGSEAGFLELVKVQLGLLYAIFVSPTPGGSGVGEIGGLMVFSGFLEAYQLGAFVILWRLISQYLSAVVGGVLFLLYLLKDLRS
jgi:uncharacterized protein (TIRG00374 family)